MNSMGIRERELLFDGTAETASGGRNDAASKLLVEVVVCVRVCGVVWVATIYRWLKPI